MKAGQKLEVRPGREDAGKVCLLCFDIIPSMVRNVLVVFYGEDKSRMVPIHDLVEISDARYEFVINNLRFQTVEKRCFNCVFDGKWCEQREQEKLWEVTCTRYFVGKKSCGQCDYTRAKDFGRYGQSKCGNKESHCHDSTISNPSCMTCEKFTEMRAK